MTVPLRVLGDRVLVKPDVNANAPGQTEAGVFVALSLAAAVTGEDATTSMCRGTVVAVGRPVHPRKAEAEGMATFVEGFSRRAARVLRELVQRDPCVAVNDDVLFHPDAGQETVVDGETYVILREAELLAIVEPEPVGAV